VTISLHKAKAQRGAALILFVTVLILGVAWYTVGALGKAPIANAEREVKTGLALRAGKQALLAHVAQQAARSTTAQPGRMPCPESLNLTNVGQASSACSNVAASVGRLPWRTLGIDQLRDGDGEPLWYVLSPGFRTAPINFGTTGQLTYNGAGNAAVALIIAPGRALRSGGCNTTDQLAAVNRYDAPLVPANFLECGNETANYANPGTSQWTNDRVISITAAEWTDVVAGPLADRLQREVAPALEEWRAGQSVASWGQSFLPHASTFSGGGGPSGNDLCGDVDVIEGMPPFATVASSLCDTAWLSGVAGSLGAELTFGGCTPGVSEMRCVFTVVLAGVAFPTITATAPRIGHSFRSFDPSQITIRVNGAPAQPGNVSGYSASVSSATGEGTISFQITFPLLSISDTVEVRIPNPSDFLLAEPRTQWLLNNGWGRFLYYGVSRASTINPMTSVCNAAGDAGCLNVNGMPAPSDDKRLVLAIMGRALAVQIRPSASEIDYLEQQNASTGDAAFESLTVNSTFNDRVAACPFNYTTSTGPLSPPVCN
jgi:hypothetical protein